MVVVAIELGGEAGVLRPSMEGDGGGGGWPEVEWTTTRGLFENNKGVI